MQKGKTKGFKRLFFSMGLIFIVLGFFCVPVKAEMLPTEVLNIENGEIYILSNTTASQNKQKVTFDKEKGLTLTGNSTDNGVRITAEAGEAGDPVNLTLDHLQVDMSGHPEAENSGINIYEKAFVKLTLAEGSQNSLKGSPGYAGIQVQEMGGKYGCLLIDGEGELLAQGGTGAAGIGGGGETGHWYANGGKIRIDNGKITARGGEDAAGIGGGIKGSGGVVLVNGGHISAVGGENAAGIGGGHFGEGGQLIKKGGTIDAVNGALAEDGQGGQEASLTEDSSEIDRLFALQTEKNSENGEEETPKTVNTAPEETQKVPEQKKNGPFTVMLFLLCIVTIFVTIAVIKRRRKKFNE